MRLEKISKERVASAIVYGFFHSFFSGEMDALYPDRRKFDPKEIKNCVSDCYEQLNTYFITAVFPLFVRLNYSDLDAVIADMEKRHFSNNTSPKLLLRYACGSKAVYDVVKTEYKQHLYYLLEGKFQTPAEYLEVCRPYKGDEEIAVIDAIRAMARVQMQAYAMGIKLSKGEIKTLHQATIYRLMIQGMIVLLHEENIVFEEENLEIMFRKACLNSDNFEILMNEMNQAFEDLAQ